MRVLTQTAAVCLCGVSIAFLAACARQPEAIHSQSETATVPPPVAAPAVPPPNPNRLLNEGLDALGAKQTDQGSTVRLASLQFTPGKTGFDPSDSERFDRIVSLLKEHDQTRVRIESFTDDRGSEAANVRLSKERAEAVKQALIESGIAAHRLTARGYGEEAPIADNSTAEGRVQNRRIELVFSNARGDFTTTERISG